MVLRKKRKRAGGVGIAHFNMATWDVAGVKTPAVRPLTAVAYPGGALGAAAPRGH